MPGLEALRLPGGATALKSCSEGVMPVCCLVLPVNAPLCHGFLEDAGRAARRALGGMQDAAMICGQCRKLTGRASADRLQTCYVMGSFVGVAFFSVRWPRLTQLPGFELGGQVA